MPGSRSAARRDGAEARRLRLVAAAALFAAGAALVATVPWQGAVLVTVTPQRGIDSGDLLLLPFGAAGLAVAAGGRSDHPPPPRAGTAPASRRAVAAVPVGLALLALALLNTAGAAPLRRPAVAAAIAGAVIAAGCAGSVALAGRGASDALRRRALWCASATAALAGGYLADTWLRPLGGTVTGPLALAVFVAVTRRPRRDAAHWWLLGAVLTLANAVSLADVAGLDVAMASRGGGPARTAALGIVAVVGGLGDGRLARRVGARECARG